MIPPIEPSDGRRHPALLESRWLRREFPGRSTQKNFRTAKVIHGAEVFFAFWIALQEQSKALLRNDRPVCRTILPASKLACHRADTFFCNRS